MKKIIQLMFLLVLAGAGLSANNTYSVSKMYADNAYISGFSSASGDTLFFSTQMIINNASKYEIKYYLNGAINTLKFNPGDIQPQKIIHTASGKFLITYDNLIYKFNQTAGSWEKIPLPVSDYLPWDLKSANGVFYLIPVTGDIYYSDDLNNWKKLNMVYTEGSAYSSLVFNNKIYLAKRDSLFFKEGDVWKNMTTDKDETTNFEIEGMYANSSNVYLYDKDDRIYRVADTGMVSISKPQNKSINGMIVLDNEDIIISSSDGIYLKVHGQNEYQKVYSYKGDVTETESIRKINKLVKFGSNSYAAVLPNNYVVVSADGGITWRSVIVNINNIALNNIAKNNTIIAASGNSSVFFSDTTNKIWYELPGLDTKNPIVGVYSHGNTFAAVFNEFVFVLNPSLNKWEKVYTSNAKITDAAVVDNNLFISTEKDILKNVAGSNNFSSINSNLGKGKLTGNTKLFFIDGDGRAKELNAAGQVINTYDFTSKNIHIADITIISNALYAATDNGLLKLQSAADFNQVGNGINNNQLKMVYNFDNRLFVVDRYNNVYYSNNDLSRFTYIEATLNSSVTGLTAEPNNIYFSTNNGAYWVSNISDEIFASNDYWINKGKYFEHSKTFGEFAIPELMSVQGNLSFVYNTNSSNLVKLNLFSGKLSQEINLSDKYSKYYENKKVVQFYGNEEHNSILFAPVNKPLQDSIFRYNFKGDSLELQKKLTIEGITAESKELSSSYIQIINDFLFYNNYQTDQNNPKSTNYNLYKTADFNALDKLQKFSGDHNGVIDKIATNAVNKAATNDEIIIARTNSNKDASAEEKGMISIFEGANSNNSTNVMVSNSNKITGIAKFSGSIGTKQFNNLVYAKTVIGEISNDDAVILYDLKTKSKINEIKGYRVSDLKKINNNNFVVIASNKEGNQSVNKMIFYNAHTLDKIQEYTLSEQEIGQMTVDANSHRIIVFGKDGKIRAFENPRDDRVIIADFFADNTIAKVGQKVKFFNTSSGEPTSVLFDFGDGATGANYNEEHTYKQAGVYTVKLTVFREGAQNTTEKLNYIKIIADTTKIDFKANVVEGFAPFEVNFTEYGTEQVTERHWDFGDGETSKEKNPTHNYTKTGVFHVSLIVAYGSTKDTVKKEYYIKVDPEPENYTADFFAYYGEGAAPFLAEFADDTKGGATEWLWDFGDGGTSTEKSPKHLYREYGSYTVSLQVAKDGFKSKTTKIRYIKVSRGSIPQINIKDEIELADTLGSSMVGVALAKNADSSVIIDVRQTRKADTVGKVAFYEIRNIERNPIRFANLPQAFYTGNLHKFVTPVEDNQFMYISQYKNKGFNNFVVYNTALNGEMKSLSNKFEMQANIVPVAYEKFGNNKFVAYTVNDSAMILSTYTTDNSFPNVRELFNKQYVISEKIPLLKMQDNYCIIYKSEGQKLKYMIFSNKLDIVKNGELFDNNEYYITDAYFDKENNLILTGEKKFKPELNPYMNYIAKLDKNFNVVWSKEYTAKFKVAAIEELMDRWDHKRYVCAGKFEDNCAIFGFNQDGGTEIELPLKNRKGGFNDVINVNNGELIFTGGVYSNIADRYNFYTLHLSRQNSYSSVSTSEISNELAIYPNPSTGFIYTKDMQVNSFEVYDQSGRKLYEEMNPAVNYYDLSFLQNGFYTIVIRSGVEIKTGKLIINK